MFYGCSGQDLNVDISKVDLKIGFHNLDSLEFSNVSPSDLKTTILNLGLYPDEIISYQMEYCLGVGKIANDSSFVRLKMFTQAPYFIRVHQAVKNQIYPNLPAYNNLLLEGFKRLKVHSKTFKQPEHIVYINSTFSSSVFSTGQEIGVSLERYLSDTSKVIKELPADPFYDWLIKKFDQKFLVRDVLLGWILTHISSIESGTLADKMIQYGKALYLTKAALPGEKDALILRYSEEEYKWARENEVNFWEYLVKQKLLYTTNERDHTNFLNDGPTTSGLPTKGAPDKLGQFLGYQMVLSYLGEHPKTKLEELVKLPTTEIIKEYQVK